MTIQLIFALLVAATAIVVASASSDALYRERRKREIAEQKLTETLAAYMEEIEFTRQLTVQRDELALLGGEAVKELTQLRTRHEGLRRAYTQEEQRSKEIELRQRLAEGWFHLPSRQPHLFEN